MFYYAIKTIEWLNPLVFFVGLCISVWAFRRSHKRGYLVLAFYFGLVVSSLVVWPRINRAIHARKPPDISEQTQQKIDASVQEAVHKVLVEEGHPEGVPAKRTMHFPFGPILLVIGLWLVARRETHQANPVVARKEPPRCSHD